MTFNDALVMLIKDSFKRKDIVITNESISKRRKEILSKSKVLVHGAEDTLLFLNPKERHQPHYFHNVHRDIKEGYWTYLGFEDISCFVLVWHKTLKQTKECVNYVLAEREIKGNMIQAFHTEKGIILTKFKGEKSND